MEKDTEMIKANCNNDKSVTEILWAIAVALTFEEAGPFYLSIDSANIYETITVLSQGCRDKTAIIEGTAGQFRKGRGQLRTCWEGKGGLPGSHEKREHLKDSLPPWF